MKPETLCSVVPWRNLEQFCKVYKCLFSNNITDKRWAVDQISEWETRCHPTLPTAIEVTHACVRAVIQDTLFQAEKTLCVEGDIKTNYAMALIRFVNLTLEADQKTPNMIKRNQLAQEMNIPSWIIDLRHQSAHAGCPSLPLLRMGGQFALEYLDKTYWRVEAANIRALVHIPPVAEKEIQNLITQYRSIQHERRERKEGKYALRKDLTTVLKKLARHMEFSGELVVKCLMKQDVFVSSTDIVKILHYSVELFVECDDLELPELLIKFWIPMIRLLHSYDLIPLFLEKLLLSQEMHAIPINNKLAAAWSMKLLLTTSEFSSNPKLYNIFKVKSAFFDYFRILHAAAKGANQYYLPLYEILTARLGNRERFSQLMGIVFLHQGWLVNEPHEPRRLGPRPASRRERDAIMQEIVFTLEDAEEDLNELKTRRKRMRRDDNIYTLAPVSWTWEDIPLGVIFNPIDELEEDGSSAERSSEIVKNEITHCIITNESDSEESTAEEMVTSEIHQEMYIPQMIYYRRRQEN